MQTKSKGSNVAPEVIIGILSDTHDRAVNMAAGLKVLERAGAQFYIHCGDIGTQRCIDLLAGLKCAFVWGNTDYDRVGLARYAESISVPCYGTYANLELDGKRIAVLHGDDFLLEKRLLLAQEHDYMLEGHTHIKLDERRGGIRRINPGALFRAPVKTVATLDTKTDKLDFLTVQM